MKRRNDTTNPGAPPNRAALNHYFEYSNAGVDVVADGLQELCFGEFLVQKRAVTRNQLFQALQLQDRAPKKKLGECMCELGHLPAAELLFHLDQWRNLETILVS